jgi:chromosome segregation ATPase
MKVLRRSILSLSILLLFSGVGFSATAGAEEGRDGTVIGNPPISSEAEQPITTSSSSSDDSTGDSGKLAEQFKEQAKEKQEKAKANHQEKSQAQRAKSCEARKTNLAKRMTRAEAQAKKHKAVFDKIYTRVKDFYTTKQLNVANYADLTAKVDTASAAAQTNIDALASLDVNVDCTSQTVSASVSAFQAAVKSTRDSLKAYRTSITDLITAVKGASTSTDDSSTNSSNQ